VKVILLKNMEKLGNEGEIKEVKDGYGRNYLIPHGIALVATDKNFKKLDSIKKEKAKVVKREEQKFIELKEKIDQISLTITAEAKESEELYGSISQNQILKLLSTEGVELDKDSLVLDEPINKLGVYNLVVNLYTSVKASLRVWVVKK